MKVSTLIELLRLGQALTNPDVEVVIEGGFQPKTVSVQEDHETLVIETYLVQDA
jgi:hypothetical protein